MECSSPECDGYPQIDQWFVGGLRPSAAGAPFRCVQWRVGGLRPSVAGAPHCVNGVRVVNCKHLFIFDSVVLDKRADNNCLVKRT